MKTKNVIGMFVGLLALSGVAHAQSAGVGGGGFTEPEMKGFMNILSDYFANKDYSGLFPEVVQWEQKNNSRMADFIKTIEPKVVNHPVYFPAGVERDCVSYVDGTPPKVRRWFECNSARVPESKLENQPKLYALLAHETFIQAGIEKAGDVNVPSTYQSSSKFLDKKNLSLETIQRYVPGANPVVSTTSGTNNMILNIEAENRRDEKTIRRLLKNESCRAPHAVKLDIILNHSARLYAGNVTAFGEPIIRTVSQNFVRLSYQGKEIDSAFYPGNYHETARGIVESAKALLNKHCR
jgi:hypothetical protein